MARPIDKRGIERRVFDALAPLVPLDVIPGSISQPPEPHPDIRCEAKNVGALAIELVALDGVETRLRLSNMHGTSDAWERALGRWAPAHRTRIERLSRHKYFGLNFSERAGIRIRTDALFAVQAQLLRLPSEYQGELFQERGALPDGLYAARVYPLVRGDGPRLIAPSAGSLQPTQIEKLEEKLTRKRYDSLGAPILLMAYTMHDSVRETGALPLLVQVVSQHLESSPFTAVYILDFARGQLEYRSTAVLTPASRDFWT